MKFNWITYNSEYKAIVDFWLDDDTRRFTAIDDSFEDYVQYWEINSDSNKGEYFWCKVITDKNGTPFGVIAVGLCGDVFTVSEYVIDPQKRNKGYGSSALKELLLESDRIIGKKITIANAVIFPSNKASQKAFEKAGFKYETIHPDGDAMYYTYKVPND